MSLQAQVMRSSLIKIDSLNQSLERRKRTVKFAVSSYSFQQYLRDGRMTQLDCVLKAKEMGFVAIEFSVFQPPEGVSLEEDAQQFAQDG